MLLEKTKKGLIKKILADSTVANSVTEDYLQGRQPGWQIIEKTTNQDLLHLHLLRDCGDYNKWGDVYNNKHLAADTLILASKELFKGSDSLFDIRGFQEFVETFSDHECVTTKLIEAWFEILKSFMHDDWDSFYPTALRLFRFKNLSSAYIAILPDFFKCYEKSSFETENFDITLNCDTILQAVLTHKLLSSEHRYLVIEKMINFVLKHPSILEKHDYLSDIHRVFRMRNRPTPDFLLRLISKLESSSKSNIDEIDVLLEASIARMTRSRKALQASVEYIQPLLFSENEKIRKIAKKLMESK